MRGTRVETLADVEALIGEAEGRHLEFKEAVPISKEAMKQQLQSNQSARPADISWIAGKKLAEFGRDALLQEIVAFANADGGILILGMAETKEKPARAANLCPLPAIFDLERRLRDAAIDCIEPRLPYLSIRAISAGTEGQGVVVCEVQPSRLAPHWVRTTRTATVRREDRCDILTMPEVHEMVLRNARAFDTIVHRLEERERDFLDRMDAFVDGRVSKNILADTPAIRRSIWLRQTGARGFGLQVSLMPHMPLGLDRLERVDETFATSRGCLQESGTVSRRFDVDELEIMEGRSRRMLGGLVFEMQRSSVEWTFQADRDGAVEMTIAHIEVRPEAVVRLWDVWLLGTCREVICVYERLRAKAGSDSLPAEMQVRIVPFGTVRVEVFGAVGAGRGVDELLRFPRYTIAVADDIGAALRGVVGDLANAGNLLAPNDASLTWKSPV
ncbi:MAG: ATP-binding protein [Methylocystis sp.]